MNRALAGVYDPSGRMGPENTRAAIAKALEGEGAADTAHFGPMSVGWTGDLTAVDGDATGPVCVIDGHVYNTEQIARAAGVPLAGGPEHVLAAAYEKWGDDLLQRLRGDFIVFLWDPRSRSGIIARDQVGGTALCLCTVGDRLLFASEARQLLRMLPTRPGPDRVAMTHWLMVSGPAEDRTLYEGIRRLDAGQYISLSDGRWEKRRYWQPRYVEPERISRSEVAERLRDVLTQAVSRCSGEDERTAIMLSGGLDSSSIGAIATQRLDPEQRPVSAYSAVFPRHERTDETPQIDLLTESYGLPSVRIRVQSGSVLRGAAEYMRAWELPAMSPNLFFWQPLLERAAEEGTEAILDGEGGDELFGLADPLVADRLRHGRLLSAARLTRQMPGARDVPWRWVLIALRLGITSALPHDLHQRRRARRPPQHYAPSWFTEEAARLHFETDRTLDWKRLEGPRWWAYLTNIVTTAFPALAYDHLDRRATLAGLSVRHPLMDVDVIDQVLRMPPAFAFDPHRSRPMLREAMKGLVPEAVRMRPTKSSFDALFHEGLTVHDLGAVRSLLGASDAEVGAYIDLDEMRKQLVDVPPDASSMGVQAWVLYTWRLVTAECWLRSQGDPSFIDRLIEQEQLIDPEYEIVGNSPPVRPRGPGVVASNAAGT